MAGRSVGGVSPLSLAFPKWLFNARPHTPDMANRSALSRVKKGAQKRTNKWECSLINITLN